ncbi:MAG: hypothetical protein Q8O86_13415 [Dehalococcoidia bacterium]|nr:hypothetical protein [Dehalococcoidia bacterium]
MNDEVLLRHLDEYLEPPADPNPETAGITIVWERDNPNFGARHIWGKHRITEEEVEQVIFEIPPFVEAKRHPDHPNRTIFWGATRRDRWIVIVCEDWKEDDTRYLRPITAFEPEEGVKYWEEYQ